MLSDVADALACPVCTGPLAVDGSMLQCPVGHTFDIARSGYVNLASARGAIASGDSRSMVRARRAFLAEGHFDRLITAVARAARSVEPEVGGVILDAGGGTGEYLRATLEAMPSRTGILLDASKHAASIAARAHDRIGVVVGDVWQHLPLRDASCAVVCCVFAPRNASEFARVLAPGGLLVVALPEPDHLGEIAGTLHMLEVDPTKRERLEAKLSAHFTARSEESVRYTVALNRDLAVLAASMGPTAAHADTDELKRRAEALGTVTSVSVAVRVIVYEPGEPKPVS